MNMEEMIFGNRSYYFISICLIILAIMLFVFRFEKQKPMAREIVMLAVLISLAVISRTLFFMTPQFKPMAAIIIISGVAMGPQAGFLCGAMAILVSNMFFGQGPWTPWQMVAFGVIGFLAGVFFFKSIGTKRPDRKDIVSLCVFAGFAIVVIYGLIMDSATVIMYMDKPTIAAFFTAYVAGAVYNVIHAVAVIVFIVIFAKPMLRKINRIKNKFGMFRDRIN